MLKIFSQEYLHDETGVRYVIVVSWVGIHQGDSVKYNIGIFHGGSSIFVKRLSCLAYFSNTSVLLVVKLCKRNIGIHIRLWSIQPSHLYLEVEQKCTMLSSNANFYPCWLIAYLLVCETKAFKLDLAILLVNRKPGKKLGIKTVRPRIYLSPQKNLRL